MNHIIKYNNFIFEKMGIINELEIISDDIISKINDKEYLKYEMNYLGFNIIINIYVLYDKKLLGDFQVELLGDFQVENSDKFEFNIRLNGLDKSTLIHELKHLDRCIRRNFKTDSYFYINHIGSLIVKNYKFLFKSKDDIELLLDTFYFCNPDEFESHYHNIFNDIRNELKLNNDNEYNTIDNIIKNEYIYKLYKYYYENKFDLLDFFNSNSDCNIFLDEFIKRQDLFYNKKDEKITKNDKIKYWFKSKINKIIFNDEINKSLLKQINYYINKHIQNSYKKFYKLYLNNNKI